MKTAPSERGFVYKPIRGRSAPQRFTINAMAYNDEVRLVDVFGGMQDLNHHLIRCVGDPRERFSEDALRILRAVRFSAQLNFPIEEETAEAVRELAPTLENISAERIQAELVKLLVSAHPERIQDAYELGITRIILAGVGCYGREWSRILPIINMMCTAHAPCIKVCKA